MESLDGKQRCSAVVRYLSNEFKMKLPAYGIKSPTHFKDLPDQLRFRIEGCTLDLKVCSTTLTDPEITLLFNRAQNTKRTTPGEFLNSCTTSYRRRVLNSNSELVSARCSLLTPEKRHDHVAMFARLWYAFKAPSWGPSAPALGAGSFYHKDTPSLQKFWMSEEASDHADEAAFLESLDLLQEIGSMGCPRGTKGIPQTVYVPLYKFLLDYYFKKDNAEAQRTLSDLRALLKSEPKVFGSQVAGNGEGETRRRLILIKERLGKQ